MQKIRCSLLFGLVLIFTFCALNNVQAQNSCFLITQNLSKGYYDEATTEVSYLQQFLVKEGIHPADKVTGYFGNITETSLKVYQSRHNLAQTGIVDSATRNIICGSTFAGSIGVNNTPSSSCPFTHELEKGNSDKTTNEITMLQIFLAQNNFYPEGLNTGYYGNLTAEAVKRFQRYYGISAVGRVGPKTLAKLCEVYKPTCPFVTQNLQKGYYETESVEVKLIQKVLSQQGVFSGNPTGYFGQSTETAVKAFQAKNGLNQTGIIDDTTRSRLCTLFLGSYSSSGNINGADIIVSDFSYAPQTVNPGSSILLAIKEKNIGSVEAPNHNFDLYLNNFRVLTGVLSSLKPNEERGVSVYQWTCPQDGIYNFRIVLDSVNTVAESNKTNNEKTVTINCGTAVNVQKYSCNSATWQCIPDSNGTYTQDECLSFCKSGSSNLPDVTLTNFSPVSFVVGAATPLIITEKNIGSVKADYHYLIIYISGTNLAEQQLGQAILLEPLDAGAAKD